jgi:hypothetical protein
MYMKSDDTFPSQVNKDIVILNTIERDKYQLHCEFLMAVYDFVTLLHGFIGDYASLHR